MNKFYKGLLVGIIISLIFQVLFGGWGNGILNHFINKPDVFITENIIFSEQSPKFIILPAKAEGSLTKEDVQNGDIKPILVHSIKEIGTNSSHCLLDWIVETEKDKTQTVSGYMNVLTSISNSSFPKECNKNKDCVQFSYTLKSNNDKDIEGLYGQMCLGWNYLFISEGDQTDRCITIEKDFVQSAREIHEVVYIKILDITPDEEINDYFKRNGEKLYPTIFLRDKNHKSLEYKELKSLTQDILNCTVS